MWRSAVPSQLMLMVIVQSSPSSTPSGPRLDESTCLAFGGSPASSNKEGHLPSEKPSEGSNVSRLFNVTWTIRINGGASDSPVRPRYLESPVRTENGMTWPFFLFHRLDWGSICEVRLQVDSRYFHQDEPHDRWPLFSQPRNWAHSTSPGAVRTRKRPLLSKAPD